MSDLLRVLDVQSDEVRVVNLVGATGIGKSCLAVQFGHQQKASGATVSYIDTSLLSLDSLPHVILQSTGSIHHSVNSTERLVQWLRREMKYPLVVILDNIDSVLSTDRVKVSCYLDLLFDNAATTVKVLINSRNKTTFVDKKVFEYKVEPITFDSSCRVLCSISGKDVSARDCELITKLTGNTPFCLVMIGNILKSTTADISILISDLKKEIQSKEQSLGPDRQLDACIRFSMDHLKRRLLNIGKYLSLFPGSFSLPDACAVLSKSSLSVNEDCGVIDELRQSELLQLTESNHYYFRDMIKKHFVQLREESGIDESDFWREYLKHFSGLLQSLSLKFQNHASKLQELEKQEIHHFIRTSIDCCEEFPGLCLNVLHSLKVATDSQFLVSLFGKDFLVHFLQTTLSNIDVIVKSKELAPHRADTVNLYASFALELVRQTPTEKDLVFDQAHVWLDQHSKGIKITLAIREFYLRLSEHYSRAGNLQEELFCHVQILKSMGKLSECDVKTCNCSQVSQAYYSSGEYRLSAYLQELYIQNTNLSIVELTKALLTLHACQVGNLSEAEGTARKILELYTNLTNEEPKHTHRHLELYHNISVVFHLHRWRDEAHKVEEKLLATVRETHYTKVEKERVRRTLFSVVEDLSLAKEYGAVSEVVQCALDTYSPEEKNEEQSEIAALHLLLGTAELYNGRRRESISSLQVVLDYYYSDMKLFNYARDACNAMLIQTHTELACFHIALQETLIVTRSVIDFVISNTFNTDEFSVYYIYEFPALVPGNLLADRIAAVPVGPYCIVFFLKWCLANVLYLFSIRFIVQVVNVAFILLKLALVLSVPVFSLFLIYGTVNFVKRVYRELWSYAWSDDSYAETP